MSQLGILACASEEGPFLALTVDVLWDSDLLVDNLFADLWKQVGMKTLLNRAGFSQRSGTPMAELMYCLVLWVWLKVCHWACLHGNRCTCFRRRKKTLCMG